MFWVYKTFSVQEPHAHEIKLNSFKTNVALKFIIILQNLMTTNHRKSGKSKFDRKMTEPDVVTMNRVQYKRALCLRIMHAYYSFVSSKCSYRKRIVSVTYEIPACNTTFI